MKNKPLIIIVISLFLIAGVLGSEKRRIKSGNIPSESVRTINVELTPYKNIGSKLDLIDTYRPIYIRRLDLQKSGLENPLRLTK